MKILYKMKVENKGKSAIKYGYTKSLSWRVYTLQEKLDGVIVLNTYSDYSIDWVLLEKKLHQKFKGLHLDLGIKFGGYTECYPLDLEKVIDTYILELQKECIVRLPTWFYKTSNVLINDQSYNFDSDCKLIYNYLLELSIVYGFGKVFTNQDVISSDLGLQLRTLQRKLKILNTLGLVIIDKVKDKSKFWSNNYTIVLPKDLYNLTWLGINKTILKN